MKNIIKQEIFNGSNYNTLKLIRVLYLDINARFIFLIRLALHLKKKNKTLMYGIVNKHLITRYGCFIGPNSKIGIGVKFPHPNGIIIGDKTTIGKNCTIFHQVTFGGKVIGDATKGNYPNIGDNVTIFAGAKLIGPIQIGNNSIIGANSVVNKNVPPYSVVGGIPAKIIKHIPQNKD